MKKHGNIGNKNAVKHGVTKVALSLSVNKEDKEAWKLAAKNLGYKSLTDLIVNSVNDRIKRSP